MKVVVIVPTYNERLNIGPLITALQEQFQAMSHDMHVLVVDDKSPDGTAEVVQELQTRYRNVHLLEGRRPVWGRHTSGACAMRFMAFMRRSCSRWTPISRTGQKT